MNELRQLLTHRTPLYEQAHATLDTSATTIDDAADRIAALASR